MSIAEHPVIRSDFAVPNHNHWIIFGFAAFAFVALAAVYFASTGPGLTEAELALAAAWP